MQAKTARQALLEIEETLKTERLITEEFCGFKENETLVLGSFTSLGIGDGITPAQVLSLYQQILPYRQDKIKVILTFRPDNIEKFLSVIRQDFKEEEIYVYAHGEREKKPFEDKFTASAKIIIFVSDEKSKGPFLTYKFIEENSIVLCQFLKQARVFFNLATPLQDKRNCPIGLLNKACEIISVKELFTFKRIEYVNSDGSRNISSELGKIATSEMGLLQGQAGMFLDERLVRLCQDKELVVIPEDFDNVDLAKAFLAVKGCNVVGYVQQLSALQLSVEVVRKTTRSEVVNLLSRQNELTNEVLSQAPFNNFSTIELYDHRGTLTNTVTNFGKSRLLRVFNFSGISNIDKRFYLKSADITLGSGDSSFQECIATGKLFVWEVPTWKAGFMGRLVEFCVTNEMKTLANYFTYLNKSSIHCAGVARIEEINQFLDVINGNRERLIADCEKLRAVILKQHNFVTKFKLLMSKPEYASRLFLDVKNPYGELEKLCIDSCNNIISNCDDLFYQAIHKNDTKALKLAFDSFPFLNLDHAWKIPAAGMTGDEYKLVVFCVRVNPKATRCFLSILNHYSDYGKGALVLLHLKDAKVKLPKQFSPIFEKWKNNVLIDAKDFQSESAVQSKKK